MADRSAKIIVSATPYTNGKIEMKLQSEMGGIVETLSRRIIDTQEHAVRQALISLGWQPPYTAPEDGAKAPPAGDGAA